VVIDLPFDRDFAELLAHEFEHVIEQLEGVDLRQRATEPHSGVRKVDGGAFETDRANKAGRAAALEVVNCRAGTEGACSARIATFASK
jgi:hypothetical protein